MDRGFADIDILNLVSEWVEQPRMALQLNVAAADARLEHTQSKNAFEVVWAETDRKVRTNPEAYEIAKLSEKAIDGVVQCHPDVKAATAKMNRAKHALDIAEAACTAIEHKKRALENLTELDARSRLTASKPKSEAARNHLGNEQERKVNRTLKK